MDIIHWISIGLVIVSFIIWFRRMLIKLQLERIQLPKNIPDSFQRKLDYVKQQEQVKHVSALLFVVFILAMTLLLIMFSLFQLEHQQQRVTEQNNQLKDELYLIKKDQKQLISKMPIKDYPKDGINLQEYPWEELFSEENREKQYKLESDLSAEISPYFGISTTLIVIDVPTQTLNIALAGDSGSENNLKQIKENINAFAKEAEGISKLTQITFQMNLMNDKEKKQTYSCTFSRENGDDTFSLIQEK
ncbi:hypothetical protein [Enterococcus hulanensis]|uniref:hypothetical protein n=1 Tax=Enterococcus hulanensis TaxID=2559929 RepID=UPI0010F9A3EB|nr:hypothetical protein [Enterococcus hulanensis]